MASTRKRVEKVAKELMGKRWQPNSTQGAYQEKKRTTGRILIVLAWIANAKRRNWRTLVLNLIDFQMFFDTIRVARLEQKLRRQDVGGHVCDVLVGLAQESRVRVEIGGCISEPFPIDMRVAQGSTWAPDCAIFYLEHGIVEALDGAMDLMDNEELVQLNGATVSHIEYADDLITATRWRPSAQKLFKVVMDKAEEDKIIVAVKKCELVVFDLENGSRPKWHIECGDARLEETEEDAVKYLGFWLELDAYNKHLEAAHGKLKKAAHLVAGYISKYPGMNVILKRKLHTTIVRGSAMSGCEIWAGTGGRHFSRKEYATLKQMMHVARRPAMEALLWILKLQSLEAIAEQLCLSFVVSLVMYGDDMEVCAVEELRLCYKELGDGWWQQVVDIIRKSVKFQDWCSEKQTLLREDGVVSVKDLLEVISSLRYEEQTRILDRLDKKHVWLAKVIPSWSSYRPWALRSKSGKVVMRWLMSEHNLEVETGRYKGTKHDERWCKRCLKDGVHVIGDEDHALGKCPRGYLGKAAVTLDLLDILERKQIEYDDGCYLSGLIPLIEKVDDQDLQNIAWSKISSAMQAVEKDLSCEG